MKKYSWFLVVFILIAGLALGYLYYRSQQPFGIGGGQEPINLYFPVVLNQEFPEIGVQVDGSWVTQELIAQGRIYQSPAHWTEIEAEKGVYNYPEWLDRNVEWFGKNPIIIGAKTVPTWARLWPEFQGSPPKDEAFPDYANFLISICNRYHPWGIEMFNEPDVGPEDVPSAIQYYFGAWVLDEDFYGAGFRYGRMTTVVYPLVKEQCPDVQLIAGALAGNEIQSSWFLRGMLDAGLKTDYISFHKYVYGISGFPSVFTFSKIIKELTDLPQIVSETNLISSTGGPEHEALKAEYITYLRENLPDPDITTILIYGICNTWMNSALAPNCTPGEAYKRWAEED